MNYIDKIISDISRAKEIIESWNVTVGVADIERKLVKDYLSRAYDKICRLRVDEKQVKTIPETHKAIQKTTHNQPVTKPQIKQEEKIETPKAEQSKNLITQETKITLGETLQKTKRFLSDDFNEKDDVLLTPIENLTKGIGLNDKFLFSKELFDGNSQNFNAAINAINAMNSFEEAEEYIKTNFSWSPNNNIAKYFMNLVRRRFLEPK